jgi:peptidyl-tRNA hydrolase
MTDFDYPCLYILMRSDMASLNPGKACAQATHAANKCVYDIRNLDSSPSGKNFYRMLKDWESDRGFGTCIVLDIGDEEDLLDTLHMAECEGLLSAVCHDPTYPLRDGLYTHCIPVNTCGYVFGMKFKCNIILGSFKLMK